MRKSNEPHLLIGGIDLLGEDRLIGADFFLSRRIYVANRQSKRCFTDEGVEPPPTPADSGAAEFKPSRSVP